MISAHVFSFGFSFCFQSLIDFEDPSPKIDATIGLVYLALNLRLTEHERRILSISIHSLMNPNRNGICSVIDSTKRSFLRQPENTQKCLFEVKLRWPVLI